MTIFYSASKNAFYDHDLRGVYGDKWPADAVRVSEEAHREFSQNLHDKICVAGEDGMPVWAPRVENKKDIGIMRRFLISTVSKEINMLSDEKDFGLISQEDLLRLKELIQYRKSIREMVVESISDFPKCL